MVLQSAGIQANDPAPVDLVLSNVHIIYTAVGVNLPNPHSLTMTGSSFSDSWIAVQTSATSEANFLLQGNTYSGGLVSQSALSITGSVAEIISEQITGYPRSSTDSSLRMFSIFPDIYSRELTNIL